MEHMVRVLLLSVTIALFWLFSLGKTSFMCYSCKRVSDWEEKKSIEMTFEMKNMSVLSENKNEGWLEMILSIEMEEVSLLSNTNVTLRSGVLLLSTEDTTSRVVVNESSSKVWITDDRCLAINVEKVYFTKNQDSSSMSECDCESLTESLLSPLESFDDANDIAVRSVLSESMMIPYYTLILDVNHDEYLSQWFDHQICVGFLTDHACHFNGSHSSSFIMDDSFSDCDHHTNHDDDDDKSKRKALNRRNAIAAAMIISCLILIAMCCVLGFYKLRQWTLELISLEQRAALGHSPPQRRNTQPPESQPRDLVTPTSSTVNPQSPSKLKSLARAAAVPESGDDKDNAEGRGGIMNGIQMVVKAAPWTGGRRQFNRLPVTQDSHDSSNM